MHKRSCLALFGALLTTCACFGQTPTNDDDAHKFFFKVGVLGAIYHSSTTVQLGGVTVPGANAEIGNNVTVGIDLGYNLTNNFAIDFFGGIPPKATLNSEGTIAPYGPLGAVRYGPVVLSGLYRVRRWGKFQPYAGAGPAYSIVVENINGAISGLKVYNHFGFTLQAGADYMFTKKWGAFVDFKETFLTMNARGNVGGIPGTAHITVDPSVVSAGVKYTFR